jgi:polyisoprenoid-binding protein YceI
MATWNFDPAHTKASFSARHMMVTTVHGTLGAVSGALEFDAANPAAASVAVTIDTAGLSSGAADRDNHLRSADFLDVAHYPTLAFKSTRVELKGENTAKVYGDLTIRDVTRPVVIDAEYIGQIASPFGDTRVGFTGTTRINREDWGLTWNMALEAGGVLVSRDIRIELDAEAILVTEPASVASAQVTTAQVTTAQVTTA